MSTNAIQTQIDALPPQGGTVNLPLGITKLTEPLNLRGKHCVHLKGHGAATRRNLAGSILKAVGPDWQDNAPVIDLTSAESCHLEGFSISTSGYALPGAGILLGRDSEQSSGFHRFTDVKVNGTFAKATVVNIGSEMNHWTHCWLQNLNGLPCYWTASKNTPEMAGLKGGFASNVTQTFTHCTFRIPNGPNLPAHIFKDAVGLRSDGLTMSLTFNACQFKSVMPTRSMFLFNGSSDQEYSMTHLAIRDCYTECKGLKTFVEYNGPGQFDTPVIENVRKTWDGPFIKLSNGAALSDRVSS